MEELAIENKKLFEIIDKALAETVDKEITQDLGHYLDIVKKESRALASSLTRCFNNARKSLRYVLVYNLGKEDTKNKRNIKEEGLEKYLADYLKEYFEKNDFMHYREFIRLNRACAIDVGIDISSKIKDMYNEFLLGKRLVEAYKLGKNQGLEIRN